MLGFVPQNCSLSASWIERGLPTHSSHTDILEIAFRRQESQRSVARPHGPGLFFGQWAQYCGTQHAKMYINSPEDFNAWVRRQRAHPDCWVCRNFCRMSLSVFAAEKALARGARSSPRHRITRESALHRQRQLSWSVTTLDPTE